MKRRILFLIPTLGNGGAERVLVNLVNHIDFEKYDVTVQTLFDEGVNKKRLSSSIRYMSTFKHQFRGNSYLMKMLPAALLYRMIVREKYDIVASYLEGPTTRIISGCPDKDTIKICWIHTTVLSPKMYRLGFLTSFGAEIGYSKFRWIVGVSEGVSKAFLRFFNGDKNKVVTKYNTNDTERILTQSMEPVMDLEIPSSLPNVCTVGKLQKVKGFDRLIAVHKRLIDEGVQHHIYVIGEGNDRNELQESVNRYGVTDTFHMIGFRDNPYKYMRASDVCVCSSYREGFSTAITESVIVGTPAVSTCVAGATEILGENDAYGIVTENTEEGLYVGLKRMLTEPGLTDSYRKKLPERMQMFMADKTVKAVEDLFS